jgi:hypothetical protein
VPYGLALRYAVEARCAMKISWLLLPAALLSLSVAGCVSKPTVKLNHAEITGVSFGFPPQLGVLMNVVLEVHNPNSYDVAVRGVRGQAVIANQFSVPVDFRPPNPEGVWLPAKQTSLLSVPMNIPVQTGLAVLSQAYGAPAIPYRFTGRADVTATRSLQLEKDDYAVDEQGQIPRQQLEAALHIGAPRGW